MRICPKCNTPHPSGQTVCRACKTPMPKIEVQPEPKPVKAKQSRLSTGIGIMTCICAGALTLLATRSDLLPARLLGISSESSGTEYTAPVEPKEQPKPAKDTKHRGDGKAESADVKIPIDDPEVPLHQPNLRNPMDVLAEASILRHGDPKLKVVALTFDDGPHPVYTKHLLEILDRYGVKATFFVVGKMAQKYPDTIRAIYEDGHIVGNHTWDHQRLAKLSDAKRESEWEMCNDAIYEIIGRRSTYCRPPGCNMNADVTLSAAHEGMTTVLYTANPGDYANPGKNAILSRTLHRMKGGGDIILLHDGIQETIDVLPKLIEVLQAKGYQFVTVEEMEGAQWRNSTPAHTHTHTPAPVTTQKPEPKEKVAKGHGSEEAKPGSDIAKAVPIHRPAPVHKPAPRTPGTRPKPSVEQTPKPEKPAAVEGTITGSE